MGVKKVVKKGKKAVKKAIKKHLKIKKGLKIKVHKKLAVHKVVKKAKTCNVSKNGRCGPKFNHTICAWGQCSRWSWCGNGGLYLSTQQKAYNSKPGCAAKKVIKKDIKKGKKATKKPKKVTKKAKKVVVKAKKVIKKKVAVHK